jgi:CheY-like chemotaxis protein
MSSPSKHPMLGVDDGVGIRDSLALLLVPPGYVVPPRRTALLPPAPATNAARQSDFIVSDLNMPQMSGHELLSAVRRRVPQITTVAMSGDYQSDAVPAGVIADAFFAKGQSSRNLLATIAVIQTSEAWVSANQRECSGLDPPVTAVMLKGCRTW